MIIGPTPVVPAEEYDRGSPVGALHCCVNEIRHESLPRNDKSGWVFATIKVGHDP